MKKENFIKALEIISKYHTTNLVINKVKPNQQVTPVLASPTIQITGCCAAVINNLKEAGFSLSMQDGMMSVEDYSIRVKDAIDDLKPYSAG